jgi:hypothetical protein
MYGRKIFLLTKIKPEYSYIVYNPTHFPALLVCRIKTGSIVFYFLFSTQEQLEILQKLYWKLGYKSICLIVD